MTEARPAPDCHSECAPRVRSSAVTVLVLLLFTSGVFAVTPPDYGPAANRVLVLEGKDCSLPGESRSRTAAAIAAPIDRIPLDRRMRPLRRALRVVEGLPAPRAPGPGA